VRPKGVADGHPVNIPDLPKSRLTMGRRRTTTTSITLSTHMDSPVVPPQHSPPPRSSVGRPAPGPKLQAPPLPTSIYEYSAYLAAYRQYMLASSVFRELDRVLGVRDPKYQVPVESVLNPGMGLSFSFRSTPGSGFFEPCVPKVSIPVPEKKQASSEEKGKGKLPPHLAPPVSFPPGFYMRAASFADGIGDIEEARENGAESVPESPAALMSMLPSVSFYEVPEPQHESPPPKSSTKSASAKKARIERRQARKALRKAAEMSLSQLKAEKKKEEFLVGAFPGIRVPSLFLNRDGGVQSAAGLVQKTQKKEKLAAKPVAVKPKARSSVRKRSPSYMRRLAKRQLKRFAKGSLINP